MPNKEDAIISSWMAEHGHPELAWDPAKKCPQGHLNETDGVGDYCSECMKDWAHAHQEHAWTERALSDAIGKIMVWIRKNPADYEQWRIQAVPKDFTRSEALLAAVKVFCDETGNGWRWQRFMDPSDGYHGEIYGAPPHAWMHGGDTPEAALRAALSAAIEFEKWA